MAIFSISAKKLGELRRRAERAAESQGGAAGTLDDGPPTLQLQWMAGDKATALGEAMVMEVEAEAPIEAFHHSGKIQHLMEPAGLAFDAEAPDGAEYLQVSQGEESDTYSVGSLSGPDPLEPEEDRRFDAEHADFVFPIFAERFSRPEPFFAAVQSLYDWIVAREPFNEPGMDQRFALHGYYWSTNATLGQFNTRDISYNCALGSHQPAVTFLGNNAHAKAALGHLMLGGKYGLVLINSSVRGGAGGMAKDGYPAWASITACPGETWQAVALHEIGHALGLADEYLDSNLQGQQRQGEPNCAVSTTDVPWAFPAGTHVFTRNEQKGMARNGPPGLDHIGLFEGARYRPDYYRASLDCLMHHTDCLRFCNVCRAAIRAKLQ